MRSGISSGTTGRAAQELGLGVRVAERFVLRALLEQDASGTLAWLGGEAEAWTERHRAVRGILRAIAEFWQGRAEATAVLVAAAAEAAARADVARA
jgi:hypothetical protein